MKRGAAARKRKKSGEEEKQGELGYSLSFCEQAEKTGHTTRSRGGPVSTEQWRPITCMLQASPCMGGKVGRSESQLHCTVGTGG